LKKLIIIGIGAGNPEYMTIQAIKAMNKADVFFIPDKGSEKAALRKVRIDICERFMEHNDYRVVGFDVPSRPRKTSNYPQTVSLWHDKIRETYKALIETELLSGQCGAFLVWGDPGLYDSTLRIIDVLRTTDPTFDYDVIPGITSVQALTAQHRIAMSAIGEPLLITPARKLDTSRLAPPQSVAVMLESGETLEALPLHDDMWIYWGAYLGTEHEILMQGQVKDVLENIKELRKKSREKHGWIMDVYLLRRHPSA